MSFQKKRKKRLLGLSLLIVLCLLFLLYDEKKEQETVVIISEIMSGNGSTLYDENYDCPDWVEFYNPSDADVDLNNFLLIYQVLGEEAEKVYIFRDCTIKAKDTCVVYFEDVPTSPGENERYTGFSLRKNKAGTLTLKKSTGETIDYMEFPKLQYDEAYGRVKSTDEAVGVLAYATPGKTNCGEFREEFAEIGEVSFSCQGGFYEEAFELALNAEPGCVIYYTLDGSEPDRSSMIYTNPILIENVSDQENQWTNVWLSPRVDKEKQFFNQEPCAKAIVVRARAAKDGLLAESISTHTYFVGVAYSLPVISLSTSPALLFDEKEGMMTVGKLFEQELLKGNIDVELLGTRFGLDLKGNYNRNTRISGHVEVYDESQKILLSEKIILKLSGSGSRANPVKSMKLEKEDETSFLCNLFEDSAEMSSFVLRTTGGDVEVSMLADTLIARTANAMGLYTYKKEPCILFLDGEYWGIYYITETKDKELFEKYYGIDENDIQIVKYGADNESRSYSGGKSAENFQRFLNYIEQCDLEDESVFKSIQQFIDIENFCDYLYLELFFWNTDWPQNNVMVWRSETINGNNQYADGKWRFLPYDFDDSLINWYENSIQTRLSEKTDIGRLFWTLMRSENFQEIFYERFEACMKEVLNSERLTKILEEESSKIEAELPEFFSRWTMQYHEEYLEQCMDFGVEPEATLTEIGIEWYQEKLESENKFLRTRAEYLRQEIVEIKSQK